MKIIRLRQAEDDLLDIWLFIAARDQAAADRIADMLEHHTRLIGDFPEIGRERPDIEPGVRSIVAGANYLVLYRITDHAVEIVRYVRGRRALENMV